MEHLKYILKINLSAWILEVAVCQHGNHLSLKAKLLTVDKRHFGNNLYRAGVLHWNSFELKLKLKVIARTKRIVETLLK